MKTLTSTLTTLYVALVGCQTSEPEVRTSQLLPVAEAAHGEDEGDDEDGVVIALSQLPAVVREAALIRVPGLEIELAEQELEDGEVVYCVHGTAHGTAYEVEVTPAGTILEVETGDDD